MATFENVLIPPSDASFTTLFRQPVFIESLIAPSRISDQDHGRERAGWVSGTSLSAALTFDIMGTEWLPPTP